MATENDKPFICIFQGCGQRFANNDHLIVHQQKHEFSLKFGATRTGESLLVDQTPTPTRFLRNCEESGLFQELESNPFDQDFKQATDVSTGTLKPQQQQQQQQPDEEDDAGSKTDLSKAATTLQETARRDEAVSTFISPSSALSRVNIATSIPVAPPPNLANPERPVPMASAPAHISNASALTKQKLLQSIQVKEQQKLLEQHLAAQAVAAAGPEILAQALKSAMGPTITTTEVIVTSSPTIDKATEVIVTVPSPEQQNITPGKRRRGRKPDEEDPEVKRQKFLERNRAAASRCRAKKKVWVDNLESKAKDMDTLNQNLQQEVLMLRSEVQQLKSILIAHKDCPLIVHQTMHQQKTGDGDMESDIAMQNATAAGVTLLSQLSNMPTMSPLIASPIPSVGSVVPNISSMSAMPPPATLIMTTNGLTTQQTPEVAKDVEITADNTETHITEQ